MNFVSIIVDAILKAISYIVSAIVFIGKPILESVYNGYISKYLLSPGYAFPNIVNGSIGVGVKSLYYFVMFNIYDPVLTVVLTVLGVLILLNSSIQLGYDFRNIWIKIYCSLSCQIFRSFCFRTSFTLVLCCIHNSGTLAFHCITFHPVPTYFLAFKSAARQGPL